MILVDDVLYTGRTIRASMDALLTFGRPAKVELCILIDRRFSREVPIQADFVGRSIDTIITQRVKVLWKERDGKEEVVLFEAMLIGADGEPSLFNSQIYLLEPHASCLNAWSMASKI